MLGPSTRQELNLFLGMVNFLSQFIPLISDLTSNLRKFLNMDVPFQWTDIQEKDFKKLKNISSVVCLHSFNSSKLVILGVDASKRELGDKPVSYASKSVTLAEIRYDNISQKC